MPTVASSSPVSGTAALAATGSTALVVEYICLFTRDLRRKQKRWQDGRLKYHTFNKRIMVYDDRGNFIGDAHWQGDEDLDVGEELQLERGSAIVQVSDCVGQQTQDLSELVDKRVQEKEQRHAIAAARTPALPRARRPEPPFQPQSDHFLLRHRPLSTLIGTPTGHHGRAVVATGSPFERRHKPTKTPSTDQHDEERPGKRRKRDNTPPSKMGYARSLFGTTLSLSGAPPSSGPSQWPPVESQRRLPQMPNPRPDSTLTGSDKPVSLEPQKAATSRQWSSSIEITGVVHHSPEPVRSPRPRRDRPGRQGPSVQPAEHITSQEVAYPAANYSPLKEISNLTTSDRRTSATATKSSKPSVNTSELSTPPSLEKRIKPVGRVQKKARRSPPGPSPPPIERASVEIIEIEDEVQAVEVVERAKPVGDLPKTELRLKSRRKRGLLLVTEQEIPISKGDETNQALIRPQDRSVRRRHPPPTEASRLASDIGNEELEDRHRPTESPDAIDVDGPFPAVPGRTTRRKKKGAPDTLLCSEASGNESPQKKTKEQRKTRKTRATGTGCDLLDRGGETTRRSIGPAVSDSTDTGRAVEGVEVFDFSDEEADTIRVPKKPRKNRSLPRDDSVEPPVAPAPTGPRLVRLARKSVKSKELIGFVMEDDAAPSRPPRSALLQAQSRFQESTKGIVAQSPTIVRDPSVEMDRSGPVVDKPRDEPLRIDAPAAEPASEYPAPSPAQNTPAVKMSLETGVDSALGNNQVRAANLQPEDNKSCPRYDCQQPQLRLQAQGPTLEIAPPTTSVSGFVDEGVAELGSTHGVVGNLTKDRRHPSVHSNPTLGQVVHAPTAPQSDSTDSSDQLAVLSAPQNRQTRLVNPATRGRKAALRAHAAGQTPQSFLPPDTGVAVASARPGVDNVTAVSKAGSNEAPKIKMKFPGFISANASGPWSREAHDLFATGRPG